jgi:peptidoglycan hydrolase CwlO-like protein
MTLEKRIIEVTAEETQEVFVETVTETKEVVWTVDSIQSQITQKQNTISNLQDEITVLEWKLAEIENL